MSFNTLRRWLARPFGHVFHQVETWLKGWIQPNSDSLLLGTAGDLRQSRGELIAENAFLRQPVIVLKRQTRRPRLRARDRALLVLVASTVRGWKDALLLVKPETLLKWHRAGFRLFWRQKSRGKPRTPRLSPEVIALIKDMAVNNRLWGTKRIRGELLKLGIRVNKRTIRRYMTQAQGSDLGNLSGQSCQRHLGL
jgi:putative transposase